MGKNDMFFLSILQNLMQQNIARNCIVRNMQINKFLNSTECINLRGRVLKCECNREQYKLSFMGIA
ncbi:MAG: hypothetical protein A2Y13_03860 [Planctomycetes bacterium GWC2_45_44]|nr:MAG: hypothetical protein A2Y13_03860 [Planctomycetes bacterium GWC2_45_44]